MRFTVVVLLGFASAVHAADDMVSVPAGPFRMGSDSGEADERPAHRVDLSAFSIDRLPVTNAQFATFLDAVGLRDARGRVLYDDDDNDARIRSRGGKLNRPGFSGDIRVRVRPPSATDSLIDDTWPRIRPVARCRSARAAGDC